MAAGERGIDALLTADQRRLVAECAGTLINLAALTMLPAVSAMRWPHLRPARTGRIRA